ncbi:hypothetical protein SRABI128_04219 [Microbacterium sp. Bi128]|nr:hypothetical protein SRABI128_04219 [Microbacterium sp. Bi128]
MEEIDSAPRLDLMNAMVLVREDTRLASRSAVSATAVRRSLAPFSPRSSVSAGSQNATVVDPWGELSSETARTGAPISRPKDCPGSDAVADAAMNTGPGCEPPGL